MSTSTSRPSRRWSVTSSTTGHTSTCAPSSTELRRAGVPTGAAPAGPTDSRAPEVRALLDRRRSSDETTVESVAEAEVPEEEVEREHPQRAGHATVEATDA